MMSPVGVWTLASSLEGEEGVKARAQKPAQTPCRKGLHLSPGDPALGQEQPDLGSVSALADGSQGLARPEQGPREPAFMVHVGPPSQTPEGVSPLPAAPSSAPAGGFTSRPGSSP